MNLLKKSCWLLFFLPLGVKAQCYFQQHVNYQIDVDFHATTNRMNGKEILVYKNASPDTLKQLFFHLYWNAFHAGSMMDTRSQVLGTKLVGGKPNWDGRVRDRIAQLKPEDEGYCHIRSLNIDGIPHDVQERETIAQIPLKKAIRPGESVRIEIAFDGQVPKQIRRSGKHNAEGVAYTVSQWYPKICAYDVDGWHPNPYVAREFYGEWGDFFVQIQIDKPLIVAATGVEQKEPPKRFSFPKKKDKKILSFLAKNVHDFVWAADEQYGQKSIRIGDQNEIEIFVYYKKTDTAHLADWDHLLEVAKKVYPFIKAHFGIYPYPVYKFIQGGDGGMEYPMATLIKNASIPTAMHEWMHSWYQMMLGTNESLYAWMDEGFTSWAENEIDLFLHPEKRATKYDYYGSYFYLVKNHLEEPATKHADHFNTNTAYSIASYVKGAMFLEQLGYIVGKPALWKILHRYYDKWRFKHPRPNDFLKIAEEVSGLQLDWFLNYWIGTTETINYGIAEVKETEVSLARIGNMPMPMDVEVGFEDGSRVLYHIPLDLMFGAKAEDELPMPFETLSAWAWTSPFYTFKVNKKIVSVTLDPSKRLADIDATDNVWKAPATLPQSP